MSHGWDTCYDCGAHYFDIEGHKCPPKKQAMNAPRETMTPEDDPCKPIYEILDCLRRDYEKACKPWLDRLAQYHATQPPRPIVMSIDEARACALLARLDSKEQPR